MPQEDISIRIPDTGMTFVYSVRRGGELIEMKAVPPTCAAQRRLFSRVSAAAVCETEYYGGSEVMD
jgi:hypothetical protein